MSRRRAVAVITVAIGALLGVLGVSGASAAPPVGTDASEVTHWNQVAATTLAAVPGPNGGAPPAFSINMGMVQGAVYDAVNAIGPKQHRPYLLNRRTGARASIDAAVATAAYDVLSELVSTAPERAPFPGRAGLLSTLSSAYAASLASIDDDAFKKQGIAVGHAAADAMLDAREGDGRFGPSAWVPNPEPGHWQPLVSGGVPLLDPTPWVGNVKPFLIQSSSQFRSASPPALDSQQWATEFNEVKSLGSATSTTRTADQTYFAKWWQSAPVLSWNEVARQLIARTDLDAADSARLLALQNLSGADAAINCWNDKYHFDFWRPWNAIPRASEDRNDATEPDTTWTALLTAPYPEWTSGHNCLDAAHTTVLRMFFGDDPVGGPFQITSTFVNPGGPAVRTFDTFTQPLAELIEARIWAGLHYRSADVAGQALGRNVANYGAANYFQPTASAYDRTGPVVSPLAEVGSDDFVIGSTIGPDRALYVTDGVAGSVLRIDRRSGRVTTYADGLPPKAFPDDVGGPIDIAFSGRTAYVLVTVVSGTIFGEPFGDPAVTNGLYRIERDGSNTLVADLGQWSADNPPEPAFFVDTGVQFALEPYHGGFLVTDGHHNRVLWVSRHGSIHEVATFGNVVPTGLETAFGRVFVTQLGPIPHVPEDGKVVALRPGREPREVASGASMLIDVERGPHGKLYGLSQGQWDGVGEGSRARPNTGRLVVVGRHGELKPVVDRRGNELVLDRPTSVEFVGATAYVVSVTGVVYRVDGL